MKDQVLELRLYDKPNAKYVNVYKEAAYLLARAGLDPRMGLDDFGVLADMSIVVTDKCGNIGYLSNERYTVVINSAIEDNQ